MPEEQLIVQTWHILTLVVVPLIPVGGALIWVWKTATRRHVWEAEINGRIEALRNQVEDHQRFDIEIAQKIHALGTEIGSLRESIARLETMLRLSRHHGLEGE